MIKWDAVGVVKTEPLILSGGMREFLSLYAPLTSSPDHRIDQSDRDQLSTGTGPTGLFSFHLPIMMLFSAIDFLDYDRKMRSSSKIENSFLFVQHKHATQHVTALFNYSTESFVQS